MNAMNEQTLLARDVRALQIPAGIPLQLKAGEPVTITQALGGSYTVIVQGVMARIDGADADAIGKPRAAPPPSPAAGGDFTEAVWAQLRRVYDPEIPVNIVDLGLVYECTIAENPAGGKSVGVKMSMTAPGCGMGDVLRADAERYLKEIPGVTAAAIELVWDPPWDPGRMSEAARLELGMI
jgi:probable FeS assembly SUF system protein SufT